MGFFSFLGSAIGGLLGLGSSASANATNTANTKETNAANMAMNQANIDAAKEMYSKQEAYNREIYEDQKVYNSAEAQRQRYQDAGLNPYMMMGGSAGTAGSSSAPGYSQPSMIPMQAARVDPVMSVADGIGLMTAIEQQGLIKSQKNKTDAEASLQWQDAQFKRTMQMIEFAKAINIIEGGKKDNTMKDILNYIAQNTADYSINAQKYDSKYKYEMLRSAQLENVAKRLGLPFIERRLQAEVDNMAMDLIQKRYNIRSTQEDIQSKRTGRRLTEAQIESVYADVLMKNKQRLNMPNITKQQADQLAKAMVTSAQNAADLSGWDTDLRMYEWQKQHDKGKIGRNVEGFFEIINPFKGMLK